MPLISVFRNGNYKTSSSANFTITPIVNISAQNISSRTITLSWGGGVGNNIVYTFSVYNNTTLGIVSPSNYTISDITSTGANIKFITNDSITYTVTIIASGLECDANAVSSPITVAASLPSPVSRYIMTSSYLSSGYIKDQISGVYDLKLNGTAAIATINSNICLSVTGGSATVNTAITGSTSTICLNSATKMTLIWWFCQTNTSNYGVIWQWRLSTLGAPGNWENISYSGKYNTFAAFGSQNLPSGNSSSPVYTNTWIFNAVVYDSATNVADRYINPTSSSSTPTVSTTFDYKITNPRDTLSFGGQDIYANPGLTGGISDFRIYNITLTNAQIYKIYTNGMNNLNE